ncbi:DUF4169 family protein [Brevundimonas sp. SL130]|uniref:DUF4169 family protein n=1 Tax=Brevundimonas sp. SL130 TaxID=2995143 RepID=UPI00226C7B3C|nr:DUF4169 family protein [Brevundimonas sp. SL130]WAC58425.1 DUF4169 family protein [Brevundimonas sp. SL130]
MSEIINLNQARKARAKAEDRAKAAANRAAYGRTKEQKTALQIEQTRANRLLDGQKLNPRKSDAETQQD